MSSGFASQHDCMVDIADAILRTAKDRDAAAATRLTQLRLRLSREITDHCGAEVALINARRGETSERQGALIRKYHDDLLKWRHDLIACNSDWPPRRVFDDPAGFSRDFGAIAARLRERVRWEEQEFYPAVLMRQAA